MLFQALTIESNLHAHNHDHDYNHDCENDHNNNEDHDYDDVTDHIHVWSNNAALDPCWLQAGVMDSFQAGCWTASALLL